MKERKKLRKEMCEIHKADTEERTSDMLSTENKSSVATAKTQT